MITSREEFLPANDQNRFRHDVEPIQQLPHSCRILDRDLTGWMPHQDFHEKSRAPKLTTRVSTMAITTSHTMIRTNFSLRMTHQGSSRLSWHS